MTSKRADPLLLDISDHFKPDNTIITKELFRKFNKKSLVSILLTD